MYAELVEVLWPTGNFLHRGRCTFRVFYPEDSYFEDPGYSGLLWPSIVLLLAMETLVGACVVYAFVGDENRRRFVANA